MAHCDPLDFDAFVARKARESTGGNPETQGRAYTYVSDRQMRAAFERMKPVELAVGSVVRLSKQVMRNQLLGHAVKVSERQFPRIHRLGAQCAEVLQIAQPTLYIVSNPSLNAATYGTDDEAFIMVHSALVDHYSDEELLAVLGHECGHIHNNHVVYLTTLYYLTHMASMFVRWILEPAVLALRAWSRRAEITCDRAGMLCAKSLPDAERALTKLALGSRKLYEEFNIDVFLEQHDEGREGIGRFMEMFATHPWLPKRVLAMRAFGESALYKRALGQESAPGLTMEQVDERVRALLKGDA